MRKMDGFEVHRDCWEYSYIKTCNYPSKNDCRLYEHCYAVANPECLLKDSLGSCVDLKREFSCKSWQPNIKENQEARVELVAKDGIEDLICKSIPCIDGNCIDKSYLTNGEMMDSVSKLYAASYMKPDKDYNFNLFAGYGSHCSKKPIGYSNCCPLTVKGWGMQLGAKCSKDEISLIGTRSKNLCVYVGKQSTKKVGVTTVTKHHFCCFGNMLEKVIQVEGRKQLGINFGNGGSPNCRGLTMQEIQTLDFSHMDFSEFINELMVKFTGTYKAPNPNAIADTIQSHMNIRKYDGNEDNADNRFAGLNTNIKDNSWEVEEERRIAVQKAEQARLARLEKERQEQARMAKLAQLEEEQKQQRVAIESKRERLAKLAAKQLDNELIPAQKAKLARLDQQYETSLKNRNAFNRAHMVKEQGNVIYFSNNKDAAESARLDNIREQVSIDYKNIQRELFELCRQRRELK